MAAAMVLAYSLPVSADPIQMSRDYYNEGVPSENTVRCGSSGSTLVSMMESHRLEPADR